MRRIVIALSVVVGTVVLVVGVLAWMGRGPFAEEAKELTLTPLEIQTLGEGGDPLAVVVMFPWRGDGVCSGQFSATAQESATSVVVSQVKGYEWPPDAMCAGLGTDGRVAGAFLMLGTPLGDRVLTRSVDGATLPVLDPCERDGVPAMCPRSR